MEEGGFWLSRPPSFSSFTVGGLFFIESIILFSRWRSFEGGKKRWKPDEHNFVYYFSFFLDRTPQLFLFTLLLSSLPHLLSFSLSFFPCHPHLYFSFILPLPLGSVCCGSNLSLALLVLPCSSFDALHNLYSLIPLLYYFLKRSNLSSFCHLQAHFSRQGAPSLLSFFFSSPSLLLLDLVA